MLQLEAVAYRAGGTQILDAIQGRVKAGSFTALMGENGSGKTSLLRLLAGLRRPHGGRILLDGREIDRIDLKARAKIISYLPQAGVRPESALARDIVLAGRKPHFGWAPRLEDEELVDRLFGEFGLEFLQDRRIETLSGGEFQKIRILRLFAQETPVILLDEPMNNLDLKFQYRLFAYLKRLSAEEGRTVVAVLHDLNMAIPYVDEFVCLKAGRTVAWGAMDEAVDEEIVHQVFGVSCRFIRNDDRLIVLTEPN